MKSFSAKEAKDGFGRLLDTAQREPVTIKKKGRAVAVVISLEEYSRLEALEDEIWGKKANEAMKDGMLGTEASEKFLAEMMNAKD